MSTPIISETVPEAPSELTTVASPADLAAPHRRIVWILPRGDDVHFEYVKRCESCPRLHDGNYGSGRFCSSRCARRVGGLAKKRMWDLTHGINPDAYSQTVPGEATEIDANSGFVIERTSISSIDSHGSDVAIVPRFSRPMSQPLPVSAYQGHVAIPKQEIPRPQSSTPSSDNSLSVPLTRHVPSLEPLPKRRRGDTQSKMSLATILNPSSS